MWYNTHMEEGTKPMTQAQPEPAPLVCSYRWMDPDGHLETCHHAASCAVCGQCSRLDGDAEFGHCTGHLGLLQWIPVPGSEQDAARRDEERRQNEIRQQARRRKPKEKRA